MILLDWLHAKAKRVVEEWISMVRRRACWAPEVMLEEVRLRLGSMAELVENEAWDEARRGRQGLFEEAIPICFV